MGLIEVLDVDVGFIPLQAVCGVGGIAVNPL
jgi:hypothetical protein